MKRLLIVVAFNEELKLVRRLLADRKDIPDPKYKRTSGTIEGFPVEVLMTSMGVGAAREASQAVIDEAKHTGVLVLGYCGGLSLTLKVGDTVVASQVLDSSFKSRINLEKKLCELIGKAHLAEGLKYRSVPLTTQAKVVESPVEKAKIYNETFAEAVDMESFEIVKSAEERHLKTIVAKVVIDDCQTQLPNYNDYFEKKGRMDHLNLAPVLVSQPTLALEISKNMKKANQILARSIPSMVKALCQELHMVVSKA